MKFTENKVMGMLRRSGFKITRQRLQVINAIVLNHEHLTPTALHKMVQQAYPGIGRVTIYRTLDILAKLGLICEVHADGSCRSYLLKSNSKHHHHLLCSRCGIVVDFSDCELVELKNDLSRRTGFTIEGHLLEFSGVCPKCQVSHAI
jgi:Fur family ferric uptake transcriptional regulator